MSDDEKREIRRLYNLVVKMANLAEHVEQTGSFENGMRNSVTRYNAILEHLKSIDAIPEDVFPELEADASAGALGAEATYLADYMKDIVEEGVAPEPPRHLGPDFGSLVALAPFLGSQELSKLVRERILKVKTEPAPPPSPSQPDIKTIISLAPHMKSEDIGALVKAYVARYGRIEPRDLAGLAPHLDADTVGELARMSMPSWFAAEEPRGPREEMPGHPEPPAPPSPPEPPRHPEPPLPPRFPMHDSGER